MSTQTHDIMVLETTQGPVKIEMRPDLAPQHVARIKELVQSGFYDGIVFHRVIEGFMAQTGCPHGTGTGGSGVKLKAEFNTAPHVRGTASMARAQNPDSGDSQFFICFDDARFLDRQYTVWGQVISGMDNVDKIKRGEPVRDPDKIVKAYIEGSAPVAEPVADHDDHASADEAPVKAEKKAPAKKAPAKAKSAATKKPAASKKKS